MGNDVQKNFSRLSVLQKKALRHVAQVAHDAHTGHLFSALNVLPFYQLYDFNLAVKYVTSVRRNDINFLNLCKLEKPGEVQYNIRNREIWAVPFSRTEQGRNRLECRMLVLLNNFSKKNIDISTITRQKLKGHYANCE